MQFSEQKSIHPKSPCSVYRAKAPINNLGSVVCFLKKAFKWESFGVDWNFHSRLAIPTSRQQSEQRWNTWPGNRKWTNELHLFNCSCSEHLSVTKRLMSSETVVSRAAAGLKEFHGHQSAFGTSEVALRFFWCAFHSQSSSAFPLPLSSPGLGGGGIMAEILSRADPPPVGCPSLPSPAGAPEIHRQMVKLSEPGELCVC